MLPSPIPQASYPTLVGAFMGMIQNQIQVAHAKTPTQTQPNPNSGNITPTSHLIEVGEDDEDVCTDVLDSLWTNAGVKKRSTSAPAGLGVKPKKKKPGKGLVPKLTSNRSHLIQRKRCCWNTSNWHAQCRTKRQ